MTSLEQANIKPGFLKIWWVAIRPFALPASTMPVVFGTVLAITIGESPFYAVRFLAAFFGMAFLHTGSNLLNDVYDFKKGLDKHVNPVSGAVVRGWITPEQGLAGALVFLAAGSALGIWLYTIVGTPLLWIGLVGVAIGVLYSAGPMALKDHALGDLAVFLDFGILGALGAWTAQTGSLSWVPAVWAVPMSLLVIGILHSNNWRDLESDTQGGIHTMASLMGDQRSLNYYKFLVFGPFALVAGFVVVSLLGVVKPAMPLTFLVTFLSLPLAFKLVRKGASRHTPENPLDFLALDGATAQLNLAFGVLCTAALGLQTLVERFTA